MPNTNSEALLRQLNQSSPQPDTASSMHQKGQLSVLHCISIVLHCSVWTLLSDIRAIAGSCHHLILEIPAFQIDISDPGGMPHSYPTMWHTSLQLSPLFDIAGSWHERGLQGAGFVSVASQERQSFNVQKRRHHHRARPAGIVVVWRTRWKGGFWLDGILLSVLVIQSLHTLHQLCIIIIIIIIIISRSKLLHNYYFYYSSSSSSFFSTSIFFQDQ